MFGDIYKDRVVLITGHTGFKGSWLSLWLQKLGARVVGYSLEPRTEPSHFKLLNLNLTSIIGDTRDSKMLRETIRFHKPEIVFHLAAQPLVRYSYKNPIETFEVNIMGTINVLEGCRYCESVKAIVNVTSDKCYENKEWFWGYRENDHLGGFDPYSASKCCSEMVGNSYRNSFFSDPHSFSASDHTIHLASARAGNVIGGGDWAEDRIIPDVMRAASKNQTALIRNPDSTRPWQHVLEPLSGYLMLGQKLLEERKECAEAWNFGPADESSVNVEAVVSQMGMEWNHIKYDIKRYADDPHEAGLLRLDCSKAHTRLGWKPVWHLKKTLHQTVMWYKEFYENGRIITSENLNEYIEDAKAKDVEWIG